jgi:hypothetical protein
MWLLGSSIWPYVDLVIMIGTVLFIYNVDRKRNGRTIKHQCSGNSNPSFEPRPSGMGLAPVQEVVGLNRTK